MFGCSRVCAAVKGARDWREGDRGEQIHDLGPLVLRARPHGVRAVDGPIDGVNSARVVRGNTCFAVHRTTTIQVHRLSESLTLVAEVSAQLVSTSLTVRLLNTSNDVTLELATAPSPNDASLFASVNRYSVGSCPCKPSLSFKLRFVTHQFHPKQHIGTL